MDKMNHGNSSRKKNSQFEFDKEKLVLNKVWLELHAVQMMLEKISKDLKKSEEEDVYQLF